MGVIINNTRDQVSALEEEIIWLTSLTETGVVDKTLNDKEHELTSQQVLLISYQEIYTRYLVTGKVDGTTDEITSLEKNLNLYQQIYLNALNNREAVRLERMQNVTNIVQLNPAIASETPVRPRVLFNTIIGGVLGLL